MRKKSIALITAIALMATMFSACSGGGKTASTTAATAATTAGKTTAGQTTAATSAKPESTPPTRITGFMQEAGQNFPDGFKHNENWFMDRIEEMANIEWEELVVPAYSDTETKFNLMMASGTIPDFVHRAHRDDMRRYGDEGAFRDITDDVINSPVLKAKYGPVQTDAMKSLVDGKIYVLDTLPINDDYNALFMRVDLLDKAGIDKVPVTLEEFVDAMRALKKANPNSVVYTCRGLKYQQWFLTAPFNTDVREWRYYPERDKYCNNWEGDNILKSVEFSKMLYDEKLLDPEFITNNGETVNQKRLRDDCLIWAQNRGGIVARMEMLAADGQSEARMIPVQMPMAEGVGVDYDYKRPSVFGGHCIAISAKSNDERAAGAFRFIETLYSDEVYNTMIYGREGSEYEVKDNMNVPIYPAAAETTWRSVYGFAFTYNTGECMNYLSTNAIYMNKGLNDDEKATYNKQFLDSMDGVTSKIMGVNNYDPAMYFPVKPDNIVTLVAQANTEMETLMAQAIVGDISLEDFAVKKEDLVKRYQEVTDYYNEQLKTVKENYDLTATW